LDIQSDVRWIRRSGELLKIAIFLPMRQAAQIRAALDGHDQVCVADSWDSLEALVRLEPLSVVVFNPATDGTMDNTRACRLICRYSSIPFVAYVPVDASFVRGIAHMSNDGLQDVVVFHADDSPSRFRKTLERVSSVPQVSTLAEMLEPWFRRLPGTLVDVLKDALRQPHEYASAEDVAAAASMTVSALYRSFRHAGLNSPKSFVVGARVFRGYVYMRDVGFSVCDVATKLGYTHPRIFAHHVESVLGASPSRIRHSLDDSAAQSRIVSWFGARERSSSDSAHRQLARIVCFLVLVDWAASFAGTLVFS
jgi:AraC-like DNA-binding protein